MSSPLRSADCYALLLTPPLFAIFAAYDEITREYTGERIKRQYIYIGGYNNITSAAARRYATPVDYYYDAA